MRLGNRGAQAGIFGLCILAGSLSACGDDSQSATGGGKGGGGAGGAGGTGGEGPVETPQSLMEPELTRITTELSTDAMNGRNEGTPESAMARAYIIQELQKCGVEPAGESGTYEQAITTGVGTNILGKVTGTDESLSARHILISAHYDHIVCTGVCNGANDNAAGVAIAIGIACGFAAHPAKKSVVFASWDAEEPPTFLTDAMGSEFWADHPTIPLDQIDVSIVMDLVGADIWPGFKNHHLLGAEKSPEVLAAVNAITPPEGMEFYRMGMHLAEETIVGQQVWSDYDAFRNRGVPFLFLSNGPNRQYHTISDDLASINFPKMAVQASYLWELMRNLASSPTTPTFDAAAEDYASDATVLVEFLQHAVAPNGIVDTLGLTQETRTNLEEDLANAQTIQASGAASLTDEQIGQLRAGAQRILCIAGELYPENQCNIL